MIIQRTRLQIHSRRKEQEIINRRGVLDTTLPGRIRLRQRERITPPPVQRALDNLTQRVRHKGLNALTLVLCRKRGAGPSWLELPMKPADQELDPARGETHVQELLA